MYQIASGIVLFNPNIDRLIENIDSIVKQVSLVVLVDNGSDNVNIIEEIYKTNQKICIIRNEKNYGIAKALNQIMSLCQQKGYDWVLTLDQDSVCPNNIIEEYKKYMDIDNIAIISPIVIDRNRQSSYLSKVEKYEFIDMCITSASLTNVGVWEKTGKFDEVMFIDLVDFEYCKRIMLCGYKIIRVNTVKLLHEIGHIKQHKFLFWTVEVKNHSAFRKYYMARNIIYFDAKYRNGSISVKAYCRVIKIALIILLYEKEKYEKISNVYKGVQDGKMEIKNFINDGVNV